MQKRQGLIKSAAILCIFSLLTKGLGMIFRVYLSNRIGSEGMGLYQLVLSVYTLFTTFATAGLTVSVSRLTAESLENINPDNGLIAAKKIKNTGISFSLLIGFASLVVMLSLSKVLALFLLDDLRTVLPMKILSLSMPFMAAAACYKGYFIASRKVIIPASAQLFEQLVKIGVTVLFFVIFLSSTTDIGKLTVGITAGLSIGEALSCIYLFLFDAFSKRKIKIAPNEKKCYPYKKITGVALPIAVSSYVSGLLHTGESVLIPYCFSLFGGDRGQSLSDFGIIRGMAIPILFFPFAFLASLISILIPEISRLNTFKDKTKRDKKIEKILKVTFLFSIVTGGIFYFIPREIGLLFYKSEEATYAMKILAIVTPFMYIETISDGILKGIGEEKFTMRVSIYNSVSRILIILFLLPRYGANGYLWLLVVSNTFSFFMCYFRLKIKSSFTLGFVSHFMMPCIITVVTGIFIRKTLDFLQLPIIISSIGGALVYIMIFSILILPVIKYANRKNI